MDIAQELTNEIDRTMLLYRNVGYHTKNALRTRLEYQAQMKFLQICASDDLEKHCIDSLVDSLIDYFPNTDVNTALSGNRHAENNRLISANGITKKHIVRLLIMLSLYTKPIQQEIPIATASKAGINKPFSLKFFGYDLRPATFGTDVPMEDHYYKFIDLAQKKNINPEDDTDESIAEITAVIAAITKDKGNILHSGSEILKIISYIKNTLKSDGYNAHIDDTNVTTLSDIFNQPLQFTHPKTFIQLSYNQLLALKKFALQSLSLQETMLTGIKKDNKGLGSEPIAALEALLSNIKTSIEKDFDKVDSLVLKDQQSKERKIHICIQDYIIPILSKISDIEHTQHQICEISEKISTLPDPNALYYTAEHCKECVSETLKYTVFPQIFQPSAACNLQNSNPDADTLVQLLDTSGLGRTFAEQLNALQITSYDPNTDSTDVLSEIQGVLHDKYTDLKRYIAFFRQQVEEHGRNTSDKINTVYNSYKDTHIDTILSNDMSLLGFLLALSYDVSTSPKIIPTAVQLIASIIAFSDDIDIGNVLFDINAGDGKTLLQYLIAAKHILKAKNAPLSAWPRKESKVFMTTNSEENTKSNAQKHIYIFDALGISYVALKDLAQYDGIHDNYLDKDVIFETHAMHVTASSFAKSIACDNNVIAKLKHNHNIICVCDEVDMLTYNTHTSSHNISQSPDNECLEAHILSDIHNITTKLLSSALLHKYSLEIPIDDLVDLVRNELYGLNHQYEDLIKTKWEQDIFKDIVIKSFKGAVKSSQINPDVHFLTKVSQANTVDVVAINPNTKEPNEMLTFTDQHAQLVNLTRHRNAKNADDVDGISIKNPNNL